jgi:transglutaminase-like putative cysteine protease
MWLSITHLTSYQYSADVTESFMELRLRPWNGAGQRVHSYQLDVQPPSRVRSYLDGFGNQVQYFNRLAAHTTLHVTARSRVETGPAAEPRPLDLLPSDLLLFRAPVLDTAAVRRLGRRARPSDLSRAGVLESLDRIGDEIARTLTYTPAVTTVSTDVGEALKLRRGVCQDFAHLFIATARSAGIPSRYVSGYVYTGAGELVVGASHAWAEAWVPDQGWAAYDPTHPGVSPEHYVRLAVGRDYRDAAPTRGVFVGSAQSTMEARVEIQPAEISLPH